MAPVNSGLTEHWSLASTGAGLIVDLMRILGLDSYHGGSHAAFVRGWMRHSRHDWTLLTLPAHHWKWRMHHAAVWFAQRVADLHDKGQRFDGVFCTDMLNLAEFHGLAPRAVTNLPAVAYFHESQLLYPNQTADERDLHYAFTNFTTALAAQTVWFNSAFHRDAFLEAVREWLARMPDYQPVNAVETIRAKSRVHYPGIEIPRGLAERPRGPLRILWAARWEHDKAPELFFDALGALADRGVEFRLTVLGRSSKKAPACFAAAHTRFSRRIDQWGHLDDPSEYLAALQQCHVFVSTARHEFFGIAAVEAAAAGCIPVLPARLAYPEVFQGETALFYVPDEPASLVRSLSDLASRVSDENWWSNRSSRTAESAQKYAWPKRAKAMDDGLQELLGPRASR